MIEIERRYDFERDEELDALLRGAEKIEEKRIEDTYFDTSDFRLMRADTWLRVRDGKYLELKVGHNVRGKPHDTYTEHRFSFGGDPRTLAEIGTAVQVSDVPADGTRGAIEAWLRVQGVTPYVTYAHHRRSYQRDGLRIDIDDVNNGVAKMVEIEGMVADEQERADVITRIETLAAQCGLIPNRLGKVGAVLKRSGSPAFQVYWDRFHTA